MTRQRELRNIPASVHTRLKNIARRQEVAFNLMLDRYAAERFLYRLSASTQVNRFTLKGAALLRVWSDVELRSGLLEWRATTATVPRSEPYPPRRR